MSAPRSILVPVDGSAASLAALEHAIALAEDAGSSIDVLHVEPTEELSVRSGTRVSDDVTAELDRAIDQAFAQGAPRMSGQLSRRTVSGDPLLRILEVARSGSYELIVMGTHGYIGRVHELLGSVAEGVVRNAPCPVLTVRDPTGGYQSFAERRHGRPSVAEQRSHRP